MSKNVNQTPENYQLPLVFEKTKSGKYTIKFRDQDDNLKTISGIGFGIKPFDILIVDPNGKYAAIRKYGEKNNTLFLIDLKKGILPSGTGLGGCKIKYCIKTHEFFFNPFINRKESGYYWKIARGMNDMERIINTPLVDYDFNINDKPCDTVYISKVDIVLPKKSKGKIRPKYKQPSVIEQPAEKQNPTKKSPTVPPVIQQKINSITAAAPVVQTIDENVYKVVKHQIGDNLFDVRSNNSILIAHHASVEIKTFFQGEVLAVRGIDINNVFGPGKLEWKLFLPNQSMWIANSIKQMNGSYSYIARIQEVGATLKLTLSDNKTIYINHYQVIQQNNKQRYQIQR